MHPVMVKYQKTVLPRVRDFGTVPVAGKTVQTGSGRLFIEKKDTYGDDQTGGRCLQPELHLLLLQG